MGNGRLMFTRGNAARMLGLKLMLLSLSLSAVAVVSPVQVVIPIPLADSTWGDIKLMHIIMGTAGAGVTLWFVEGFRMRVLGATVTCGIVCAAVFTPGIEYAWMHLFVDTPRKEIPNVVENVIAFMLGVGGMSIIPGITNWWIRFKKNPTAFIERVLTFFKGGKP